MKVSKEVKVFLDTAFGDKYIALQALVFSNAGDEYQLELYDDWLEGSGQIFELTQSSLINISQWVKEQELKTIFRLAFEDLEIEDEIKIS